MTCKEKAEEIYCNNIQYTVEGEFDEEKTIACSLNEIDEILENYGGKNINQIREYFNKVKNEIKKL